MAPTFRVAGDAPGRWRPAPLPPAAVIVLTIALILRLPRPLSSDIAGQLWLAQALRDGARLYIDIVEINPPLWFWLAMPVDGFAQVTGIAPATVLIAAFGALALATVAATDRMMGRVPPRRRRLFLLYAVAVFLVMPIRDFGQREMLALLAAVPYAALAAARRAGRPVSSRTAILIGAGAAIGFALKHYFLGVPLLLELWLVLELRRRWQPLRAETLALAAVGGGYAIAILIVSPAYLTEIVPQLRLAYGGAEASWRQMILPAQILWALIAAVLASQYAAWRSGAAPLATALFVAGVGFASAWLLQHKGWPYHAIPATGTLALALAALLAEGWERMSEVGRRLATAILPLPILLALMPAHTVLTGATDITPALAGVREGEAVGLISTEGFTAWPVMIERRVRPASRYAQYWMLGAIDTNATGARDPRIARFARAVVRHTIEDYRCLPPIRVIIARPGPPGTAAGDPLAFFRRDPAFLRLMTHYRYRGRDGIFDSWQRVSRPAPMPGAVCRRVVLD